jgi:hypothetical protein
LSNHRVVQIILDPSEQEWVKSLQRYDYILHKWAWADGYSIKEIESFFIEEGKLNKRNLVEAAAELYPMLHYDLTKERKQRNANLTRAFEAVALASARPP